MKQSCIRVSLIALGALFAGACASAADGSDGWELENGDALANEDFVDGDETADAQQDDSAEAAIDGEADGLSSGEEPFDGDGELGTLQQALGGNCGSQSSFAHRVFTRVAVPDHFPPDSALAQIAATAIGIPPGASLTCVAFGIADLGPTCDNHDACYGEFGATKSGCDNAAKAGWERACKDTYDEFSLQDGLVGLIPVVGTAISAAEAAEQACRTACLGMAGVMFQAISSGGGGAFDEAQRSAAPSPSPQGPIFF